MTDDCGVSAHSCTNGAWLKVHVNCTGIFSFTTNVDDSCVLKRALIPSHNITIDPRYSLDLTIKFLQDPQTEKGARGGDLPTNKREVGPPTNKGGETTQPRRACGRKNRKKEEK